MYFSSLACGEAAAKPAPATSETGYELHPAAGGLFELKIWGKFPPRWLANLTSGLAARGISVHRGCASKVTPTLWQGAFVISPAGGEDAGKIDFLALVRDGAVTAPLESRIRLDRYSVQKRNDALHVEVEGPDAVGFLVALLKTFAFFSLFPAEVSIDTPGGRVSDHFWLKGVGGTSPSESSLRGLEIELEKLRR